MTSSLHTSSSPKRGQTSLGELIATPSITSDSGAVLPVIDQEDLLKRINGNEALANELLSMLLADLPEQTAAFNEALACGDYTRLAELAHRLAGSACYCGTPALRAAAAQLEHISKTDDRNEITKCVIDLDKEMYRLIAALKNKLK